MKGNMKKYLAAVLAAAVVCTQIPIPGIGQEVRAAETSEDFDIDSNGVLKRYTGKDGGDLVIPNGVTSIGNNAFSDGSAASRKITSVVIPEGVTSIGDSAFAQCYNLKKVVIPDTVTTIGGRVFLTCNSLTDIQLPNHVTSIGYQALSGCRSLTSLKIPASLTEIGADAFSGCSSLKSITVENGNPKYDSRNNCNAVIQTENNELVAGCQNTKIPDSVTRIGKWAFSGCREMTSMEIPAGVVNIGEMAFQGCSALESIKIPSGTESIEYGAFAYCTALTRAEIPASVTNIGEYAFDNCPNLTIYGIAGSQAETYAKEYQIPFSAMEVIFRYGDLTGEGDVNLNDAFLALKIALNIVKNPTSDQLKKGDVAGSGDGINLEDVRAILKKVLRLQAEFDVEKE